MRPFILLATAFLCGHSALAQSGQPPLQLEMRVPFEPTAFPNGSKSYLMYEVYLTNFTAAPLSLSRIDVLDADAENAPPIATFNKEQLETMLQLLGKPGPAPEDKLILAGAKAPSSLSPSQRIAKPIYRTEFFIV